MRQRSGGIGKQPILGLLVVSILLIAIGSIWLSMASVPNYEDYYDDDIEKRDDYREEFGKGRFTAQKIAGLLASIGCVLGSVISLYGGLMSSVFTEDQKKAMLILAGIFALGLVMVMNHYPWAGAW